MKVDPDLVLVRKERGRSGGPTESESVQTSVRTQGDPVQGAALGRLQLEVHETDGDGVSRSAFNVPATVEFGWILKGPPRTRYGPRG